MLTCHHHQHSLRQKLETFHGPPRMGRLGRKCLQHPNVSRGHSGLGVLSEDTAHRLHQVVPVHALHVLNNPSKHARIRDRVIACQSTTLKTRQAGWILPGIRENQLVHIVGAKEQALLSDVIEVAFIIGRQANYASLNVRGDMFCAGY